MLLGLLLFAGLASLSAYALHLAQASLHERVRLQELRLINGQLMRTLTDIETGMRGYVLTESERFLEPYHAGLAQYGELLARLEEKAEAIPAIAEQVRPMRQIVEERLRLAVLDVELNRQGKMTPALAASLPVQGKALMDRVSAGSARIDAAIAAELSDKRASVVRVTRWATGAVSSLFLVGTAAILVGWRSLRIEQTRRRAAERALRDANGELEGRVQARTEELEAARSQVELFARRLDSGIEQERRRLARDIHDELGQVFTGLKFVVSGFAARYGLAAGDSAEINALLDEGVATSRRIAGELRPPLLDDLGLGPALEYRAARFSKETGIDCRVDVADSDLLTREQALQLFRIVQEALTNVARHAGARSVRISGVPRAEGYRLEVEDDGRGLVALRPGTGGVPSMRERATLAGGRLEIEDTEGSGVRVRVDVPLEGQDA